jgi:hypothetical protein
MSLAYEIIHDQAPPRIFPECKILLQLSPDKMVGDWYLFENHTEIRFMVHKYNLFFFLDS